MRAPRRGALDGDARRLGQLSAARALQPLVAITPIGARAFSASLPAGLGARFTIRIVELPATARSVTATTQVVADVLAEVGSEAVLFGHSMNGTLAIAAAADVECAGVIAVGAPPTLPIDALVSEQYWDDRAEPRRKELAAQLITAHEATDDPAERARLRERYDRLRRWHDVDIDPPEPDAVMEIDLSWVQAVFDSGASIDWPNVSASVRCPVLLALGESDFIVPPTMWDDVSLPPRTTLVRFARSGHTPFVEEPTAFLAAVDDWRTTIRRS